MLTIYYSCDIREGTRGPGRVCVYDEEGFGGAYWSCLISDALIAYTY